MTWVAAAMASAAATTAVIQYVNSEKQAKGEASKQDKLNANMKRIEAARQKIPYIGRHYKDLSNTMSNKFANLGVATGAAKMQAEEADIALANMADVMQATGQDAGGATALAQMALKSKQGISADIQKQELQNAKNIASTQMKINEQKAQGAKWAWEEQEGRDLMQLDRAQNLYDKYEAQEFYNEAQMWNAIGNTASSLTSGLGNITQGIELDQQM